ncbi:hypothetical protein Clacol_004665 [Clathrus columnatus]|uniref:Uncharacterized protein n=1 Tax=Clathrus columnatus TaxID=1419009 RepID=A0AAV5A742_9AGAM|nr:hypothetical protein Clacol_004665 [Clathrus columnatus]
MCMLPLISSPIEARIRSIFTSYVGKLQWLELFKQRTLLEPLDKMNNETITMNTSVQMISQDLPAYITTLILVGNVAVILSDVLAFLGVIHQVWGLWKEKRKLNLHSTGKDFVTLLLQQGKFTLIKTPMGDEHSKINLYVLSGILRFSFVLFISITQVIIDYVLPIVGADVTAFQNILSIILICEFTLDLRRRNATRSLPNQSALELPDLNLSSQGNPVRSIQSVLGRLQERMIANMGERSDTVDIDGSGQGEPDEGTA